MSQSTAYFRVELELPITLEPLGSEAGPAPRPILSRQLAARAREVLSHMSHSANGEVLDALSSVLAAVEVLEREVEMLHRQMFLSSRGLELSSRRLWIGGDGLRLEGADLPAVGERARVYLSLPARDGEQLLVLDAEVRPGGELTFTDIEPSLRDRLVAFVFESQRRERRRELDAASSA